MISLKPFRTFSSSSTCDPNTEVAHCVTNHVGMSVEENVRYRRTMNDDDLLKISWNLGK